jgi:hypothetical protein
LGSGSLEQTLVSLSPQVGPIARRYRAQIRDGKPEAIPRPDQDLIREGELEVQMGKSLDILEPLRARKTASPTYLDIEE